MLLDNHAYRFFLKKYPEVEYFKGNFGKTGEKRLHCHDHCNSI